MHLSQVIKGPILTEKTYAQMQLGIYTFSVDCRANRVFIRKAFEQIFEVKVARVNIINCKPKDKRVGRFLGKTNRICKAIIKLAPGEQLTLFSEDESKAKK